MNQSIHLLKLKAKKITQGTGLPFNNFDYDLCYIFSQALTHTWKRFFESCKKRSRKLRPVSKQDDMTMFYKRRYGFLNVASNTVEDTV